MLAEWRADIETNGGDVSPRIIFTHDPGDFASYVAAMEHPQAAESELVPLETFFALDSERDIFVGAISIRYELNESLLFAGGQIGDGVRPS